MYYWSTRKLADQIKSGGVSESSKKNYYMAITVILTAVIYMSMYGGMSDEIASLTEAVLVIAIIVTGINITFATNGGNAGSDYIARVTMLSLPVMVKIFLVTFVLGILVGVATAVVAGYQGSELVEISDWVWVVVDVLIQVFFFWRINVHLAYINNQA